jgi:hypothetical protein
MSIRLLKPVSKTSQRILEHLVDGLAVGDTKKVDAGGPFMAVHVEALQRTGAGTLFSVALLRQERGPRSGPRRCVRAARRRLVRADLVPELRRLQRAGALAQGRGAEAVGFGGDHSRTQLQGPENFDLAPRVVVVEADEPDERRFIGRPRLDVVDKPLTMAGVNDLAPHGERVGGRRCG